LDRTHASAWRHTVQRERSTIRQLGIKGAKAPAWNVDTWFNLEDGKKRLELSELSGKVVYLFGFQSWCTGCHTSGFPAFAAVQDHFADDDRVVFVALQTVFEGFEVNGPDEALASVNKHGLSVPVGHDPGRDGHGSDVMRSYRSGGTPWTVVIDQANVVRFNGFQADPGDLIRTIETLLNTPRPDR
jgi:thiol-disulfide isomerase/thioredoxin